MLFYALFRVFHGEIALAAVFFRLIGTAGFAVAQVLLFASLPTLQSASPVQAFAPDQRNALAMLLIQTSHDTQTLFTMFYGVGTLAFALLMYRSALLPRAIGVLVMLAASGFIAKAFTAVLLPPYSSPLLLAPAGISFVILSCWLTFKGVDAGRWCDAHRA